MKREISDINDFSAVSIKVASPEDIRGWSHGEVTKPETINYRTQRAEKHGLFDEKIFGPTRDYECFCGKYKGIRYKGIVCDRCGVEVTRAIVRRERMGHIELASPVAHIWYLRAIPSRIATLLGISSADTEKVIYFAGYIVTKVNEQERKRLLKEIDAEYKSKTGAAASQDEREKLKELFIQAKAEVERLAEGQVLDEATYHRYSVRYGTLFEARIGAEAIYDIFKELDLEKLREKLIARRDQAGALERVKINKRIALINSLLHAGIRPEWMFLTTIPVIPPALRPMVALEGGRHASSDLNDLYRRVINRNNRLKKLMDIQAPEVILRNEKRILQEAVDALIDNSIRHGNTTYSAMSQAQRRPLKSLSDYLRGKQGYFRQNLLGKRVDYSGRSVIVVGPELKLDQCGLPKHMALELFRPFIIAKLLERELAYNIRGAGRLIEEGIPEVWAILEEVIADKHVLLNRAPTLHRQGIQAFRPVLIEGNAIRIHPLVCPAFNADFDGDQMAVHVPLSEEAQLEAREIMSANKNLLKPGSGTPVTTPSQDIVLGCYWMTKIVDGEKGEGKYFSSPNDAIHAYDYGLVSFRARIKVLPSDSPKYAQFNGVPFETSVGRLLFNSVLPKDYPYLNQEMKKGALSALVDELIRLYGLDAMPPILDKMKDFGFTYATKSGVTWSIDELTIPEEKARIVEEARARQREIEAQYQEGLLSPEEKKRMVIEVWHHAKSEIEKKIPEAMDPNGSVYDLVISGARGSMGQLTQMAGMKGLIQNTQGETIEFPITTSYKEGLTPIEYFVTTHGSRKGLADTALQTAKAGYLTRKLFDVAQDVIVTEEDCGTREGATISRESALGIETDLAKNIVGRFLAKEVVLEDGTVFKRNHFVTPEDARAIERAGVEAVEVRSPMACKNLHGVCRRCYGADLTTGKPVDFGEAVGTVAAQAIGEPGTQLTMNTKHAGGAAGVQGDVVQGLPRVEEVFERRMPKGPAAIAQISGTVLEIRDEGSEKVIILAPEKGSKDAKKKEIEYRVQPPRKILVQERDKVEKGDLLTDGSANLTELFRFAGKKKTQDYIIRETSKIYELQGVSISRKHIEVIVKQMLSRKKVKDPGDTHLNVGDIVEEWYLEEVNEAARAQGGQPAEAETHLLGIAEVSLTRQSFLSAASFQNTNKVLINAAVKGVKDRLRGLKENVIIGRLIPAGTHYPGSEKYQMITELQETLASQEPEAEEEVQEGLTITPDAMEEEAAEEKPAAAQEA